MLQTAGGGCWPNGWRGRNRQREVDRDDGCARAGEREARAELCELLDVFSRVVWPANRRGIFRCGMRRWEMDGKARQGREVARQKTRAPTESGSSNVSGSSQALAAVLAGGGRAHG